MEFQTGHFFSSNGTFRISSCLGFCNILFKIFAFIWIHDFSFRIMEMWFIYILILNHTLNINPNQWWQYPTDHVFWVSLKHTSSWVSTLKEDYEIWDLRMEIGMLFQAMKTSRWEGGDFVINEMINETEVETLKYSLLASDFA